MRYCLLRLTLFAVAMIGEAQNAIVSIHIKLVNGRTGQPMKDQQVGLENRAGYRDISVRTNEFGIASLSVDKEAVILVHNTDKYVNCGDEPGGLVHNDFQVSQILSTGLVQAIVQPNLCGKVSGVPRPGELILFVRPWRPGEKI